eukprot:Nk52_evm20s1178 gene=Nk52_evmTU20s1178
MGKKKKKTGKVDARSYQTTSVPSVKEVAEKVEEVKESVAATHIENGIGNARQVDASVEKNVIDSVPCMKGADKPKSINVGAETVKELSRLLKKQTNSNESEKALNSKASYFPFEEKYLPLSKVSIGGKVEISIMESLAKYRELCDNLESRHACQRAKVAKASINVPLNRPKLSRSGLNEVYGRLQRMGFNHLQISDVMNRVDYIDVPTCVQWLCLNLRHEDLPIGMSDKTREEMDGIEKGVGQITLVGHASDVSERETEIPVVEEREKEMSEVNCVPEYTSKGHSLVELERNSSQQSESNLQKDWIMQYMEGTVSEEEEDLIEGNAPKSEDEWIKLFEQRRKSLESLKAKGNSAKERGDSKAQNRIKKAIGSLKDELQNIEARSGLHNIPKLIAKKEQLLMGEKRNPCGYTNALAAEKTDKSDAVVERKESSGSDTELDIFDMDEGECSAVKDCNRNSDTVEVIEEQLQVRTFAYKRWSGLTPPRLLEDLLKKYHGKNSSLQLSKERVKSGYQSLLKIKKSGKTDSYKGTYICPTWQESENYVCTIALHSLFSHLPLHSQLPEPLRQLWFELEEISLIAKLEDAQSENRDKDKLLEEILLVRGDGRGDGDSKLTEDKSLKKNINKPIYVKKLKRNESLDSRLREMLKSYKRRPHCKALNARRQELPISQFEKDIVETVRRCPVVVVCGDTGCGKTTQVPQFILCDLIESGMGSVCNIVCTEPRRLSTTYVAKRVSEELADEEPGSRNSLCGYQIRLEAKASSSCRALFCTTGVLLRKLRSDPYLSAYSHVIVDEVHERSLHSDLLLIHLKDIVLARDDFKVILMSATVDATKLSLYFGGAPIVTVPGRTFPVEDFFLEDIVEGCGYILEEDSPYALRFQKELSKAELKISGKGGTVDNLTVEWEDAQDEYVGEGRVLDSSIYSASTRTAIDRMNCGVVNYDIIEECLSWIFSCKKFKDVEGSVLIFLSGFAEISICYESLKSSAIFGREDKFLLIPLHSVIDSKDQSAAFEPPPIEGQRKIVLSTNIAETGITIPDVVFVIDTGKVKEMKYNHHTRITSLEEVFVSQASSAQRKGRAGRVRPGYCFKLFTKNIHDTKMQKYSVPELLRTPLDELCLHIISCGYGDPEIFLAKALDPPSNLTIAKSVKDLREVGALNKQEFELSPLGKYLARLPVDVRIGKMIVYSCVFGCVDPVLTISAAESFKSPFQSPFDKREEANAAKMAFAVGNSDHLTLYNAFVKWEEARKKGMSYEYKFCKKYFLNRQSLLMIEALKNDLFETLLTSGLVNLNSTAGPGDRAFNMYANNHEVVKSVLVAGLFPNVAVRREPIANPSAFQYFSERNQVYIHPQSVNHINQSSVTSTGENRKDCTQWFVYLGKVKTKRLFVREISFVNPLSIILLGGDLEFFPDNQTIVIGGSVELKCPIKTAAILAELRKELDTLLAFKFESSEVEMSEMDKLLADSFVSAIDENASKDEK